MTFAGIGQPGQRETTRAGLEHDYYLVIKQVKMAIVWGWGIIFLLLAGVFAFWVRGDAAACWRWVRAEWPWLGAPYVLWAIYPLWLGIYKMTGMVSDSSWPAPREAIPADQAMPKPAWPWNRDWEDEDDEPAPPQRTVHVILDSNGGRTRQYADLPDVPGLPGFARATANGRAFTVRTAQAFDISRGDFETIRDTFLDRGWARWKGGDKRQGIEVLVAGRSVLRHLAAPTLMEVPA